MVAAVLVGSVSASPAPAHIGDDDTRPGLGEYGASGPVSRDLLPEYVANRVSDRAIELAQTAAFAAARANWNVEMDFVNRLYYQLRFRSQTDYLSTDPAHLGAVLRDRPKNLGIDMLGLYLTNSEAAEFVRRQKLGDRINTGGWDMKRMTTPQADSNCYHAIVNCGAYFRWRASHNSWEINSDFVCASLGVTNVYECGLVLEEDFPSTASGCEGSRWVRYNVDTGSGDSGSGLIGPISGAQVTIDAIHACGNGTNGYGNTAYDVKTQLGFDFNCASSVVTGRAAANWGACPVYDR